MGTEKIVKTIFLLLAAYLILRNYNSFNNLVNALANAYTGAIDTLQGFPPQQGGA